MGRGGRSRLLRPSPTKGEAGRYLAAVETEMARGTWVNPAGGKMTFGEWVELYLRQTQKRATTRARDEAVLDKHFLPELGPRRLVAITPLQVRGVVEKMRSCLAPATVRVNYGVLRAVLNAAVQADLIVRSPCRGIKLGPVQPPTRRTLSPEDLQRLAQALPVEYQPMVYLGGVMGLRWSEVAGLRVKHIDFLNRTLSVEETLAEVNGRLLVEAPKSRAGGRVLSVPPFIVALLAEHLARRERPGPDELVFVARRGGPVRATNFRERIWHPAAKAVGFERLTFHGLRHVATSLMVDSGEHPRVIQYRLGHATPSLSMGLYTHVSTEADRGVSAHLESMFVPMGHAGGTPASDEP